MAIEKKKKPKFQRTKFRAYVKLGSGQKSKQKYRRATGRHNKTRQKWKSRPPMVEIGYKNPEEIRGLIKEKTPVFVQNLSDLKKVGKDNIIVIAKIGNQKKVEIAKEITKQGLEVANLNIKKFLRQMEREREHKKKKKAEKNKRIEEKKKAEKKVEEKKTEEKKENKEDVKK